MLGKPEWFQRRKYTGWGVAPKQWQGWVYILIAVIIIVCIQLLPVGVQAKIIATIAVAVIIVLDVLHIMANLKMDEREKEHEAIAERNAAWVMVLVVVAGILFQVYMSGTNTLQAVDPFLIAAIAAGLLAKLASNLYLEHRA